MTFGQLVRKNVYRQKRLYVGYIASSSVAVMTLFMFMNFTYNPTVEHGYMPAEARVIMLVSGWIVGLFSTFFIFYFHAAMLRLRGQELGVLQVLGITPKQLGGMVMLESFLVDGVALGIGLLLGLLFTKLFLLVLGTLLALPSEIPFAAPGKSWLVTCIVFVFIFVIEAILMAARVRRRGPKQLLKDRKARQTPPKPSIILALVGIVCIGIGYYLAIAQSVRTLGSLVGIFVIIALVVIGTYFVYTQAFVWTLMRLRRRVKSGVGILTVSRLAHRMKDHARALTVIATLSAIVMTAAASQLGLLSVIQQGESVSKPFAVLTWTNREHPLAVTPSQITKKLNAGGVHVTGQQTGIALSATLQKHVHSQARPYSVTVVSNSTFQAFVDAIRKANAHTVVAYPNAPNLQPGHAVYVASYPISMSTQFHDTRATLTIGKDVSKSLVVDDQIDERTFNFATPAVSDYVLIVSDVDFSQLAHSAPSSAVWTAHGWMVADRSKVSSIFQNRLSSAQASVIEPTDVPMVRVFSMMIFAGMFIALMLLLACGNTIYFRLLNNQAEDRIQFRSLRRTGITHRELGRVLTVEFSVLFFFPFMLAALHTFAAVIDYRHVLMIPGRLWPITLAVMLSYLVFMVIYFSIARFTYPRQLRIDEPQRMR